jgi:UDP-N-acetylglucosamine 2-epimerase (non-hydrolysing)
VKYKIAICFGTRPEIIKLCLLSKKLSNKYDVVNIFTGQHHSLFENVKHLIPNIHYLLPIGEYENLTLLYADLIKNLYELFNRIKPDLVIVQGDTASAYCASFCAFIMGIKVGHVEAGLRTYDLQSPFPEEFNRQIIDKMSYYHWCPSTSSVRYLLKENVGGKIILTGNTIVDLINSIFQNQKAECNNDIIITLHRRENSDVFENILNQIAILSSKYNNLNFIFPAHPNPIIQKYLKNLKGRINVIKPLQYEDFILLLRNCRGIISDSGGIQEEAICLKKKILVCRDNTERPEAVDIGISKVVGIDIMNNFDWLISSDAEINFVNPYGDGDACDKIIENIGR